MTPRKHHSHQSHEITAHNADRAKQRRHASDIYKWFRKYNSKTPCSGCGEIHPAIIEWHHRDKRTKTASVASLAYGALTYLDFEKLREEIDKCDPLCRNCHAKHHYEENHGTKYMNPLRFHAVDEKGRAY